MADGVDITPGSGAKIATDDCGSPGHVQLFKLAYSANGDATLVPVDANGLTIQGPAADGAAVAGKPVLMGGQDGTNAQAILTDTTGRIVNVGAAAAGAAISGNPVLNAGSDGTNARAMTTDTSGNQIMVGSIAHDTADAGAPVKVGAIAVSALSTATMVAAADRTNNVSDLDGVLIVRLDRPLGDTISERISNTNGTSTDLTNFGATASTRNCIEAVSGYNDSTTGGYLDIRDGAAGAVLWTFQLPAKGGFNFAFPKPLRGSVNTAIAYDVSAALTTVYLSFMGFKSKV